MKFSLPKVGSIKGQSAIEYLMTYGWMLLVVAVVGGAVFSMVQSENIESVSGFTGADVQIEDFGITSQNELELVLRNGAADTVEIESVNLTNNDKYSYTDEKESISVGETGMVSLSNVSQGDSAESLDLTINYAVGGLENMVSSGTISGAIELTEEASETNDEGSTTTVASGSWGNEVHIWDAGNTGSNEAVYTGHSESIYSLAELSDGRIASGSGNGEVHIWDPDNAGSSDAIYTGHSDSVQTVIELSDGRIASGSFDDEVHIWDPSGKSGAFSSNDASYTGHGGAIEFVIELGDGRIASGSRDDEAHIWDPDNAGSADAMYTGHGGNVYEIIELDGGLIASGASDNEVHIWDLQGRSESFSDSEAVYTRHSGSVYSLVRLNDGNIISGANDNEAHVWDPSGRSGSFSDSEAVYTGHSDTPRDIIELSG